MRMELTPSVQRLLEQLQTPVCVYGACWTQLAWNRSFAVLLGDPSGWRDLDANLLYRYLVGAPTRVRRSAAEGEEYLNAYVADLRTTQARFPHDPRVTRLTAALSAASAHFAALWNGHDIAALHETHKTIEHPQVGLLQLDCDVLTSTVRTSGSCCSLRHREHPKPMRCGSSYPLTSRPSSNLQAAQVHRVGVACVCM
jgi:MmyB-like transcription regulator ligand binding domain